MQERIPEAQDSRVAVCKGGRLQQLPPWIYLMWEGKGTVSRMLSYIKELDGRMPVWPKEPEVASHGQKNCNQRLQEKMSATSCVS